MATKNVKKVVKKVAKKAVKKAVVGLKVGDTVMTTSKDYYGNTKPGQIGFVSSKLIENETWGISGDYGAPFHYVVYGTNSDYIRMSPKHLKKVVAQYVVTWATENNDPLEYFVDLKSAKAFMAKMKIGRQFRGDKLIAVALYKLQK